MPPMPKPIYANQINLTIRGENKKNSCYLTENKAKFLSRCYDNNIEKSHYDNQMTLTRSSEFV
jgi:hypothetical protein